MAELGFQTGLCLKKYETLFGTLASSLQRKLCGSSLDSSFSIHVPGGMGCLPESCRLGIHVLEQKLNVPQYFWVWSGRTASI